MSGPIEFGVAAMDGDARAGRITTPHGAIATPAFMPVGTRAAVKAMAPDELWSMGYTMVLANAYHLAIRPGAELIREMGGVARFMGFPGAVLTDSGEQRLGSGGEIDAHGGRSGRRGSERS